MEPLNRGTAAVSLLYVEDDQVTRETVCRAISATLPALALFTAENGHAGLEMFKEHNPDIVLTDISMPVMNGIEMARKIRELDPTAKIIAATAMNDTHYLLDAIKIGISRYVLKPIDLALFFEAIDDCLARITLERQIEAQHDFIRQLSRAVEYSPSMVLIANARGAVEYVNPKYCKITGYAPQEVIGQNLRILLAGISPSDSFEMLWSSISRGSEWSGEFINRKKDGELFYEKVSISPLAGADGAVTHFVAVLEDVSERKQCEEKLRRLNDELEQRVKERTVEMEASNRELEAFCYSVAHDLSTPLRGMSCFSSILLEDYSDKLCDSGKEHLARIGSASVRMGQLINDLLNLSKVARGKLRRESVDLSALAHDVVKMLSDQEPERRVQVAVSEGVVAEGDPTLVRLVLENLLGNAWKYTRKEASPRIKFGSKSAKGETVYFLRDNGIGFDMAYAPKIFVPFERLHRVGEFEGTGVGLATVQRIVTRHGGRVWAEGEEGKGATFFFTLGLRTRIALEADEFADNRALSRSPKASVQYTLPNLGPSRMAEKRI